MWLFQKPSEEQVKRFVALQSRYAFSYPEVGSTKGNPPPGYDHDHQRIMIGTGADAFRRACTAVRNWSMFPAPWTEILPRNAPIQTGTVVAMLAQVCGVWWLNACRIVYAVDEVEPIRCFGFAYGTLPGHVECGEERFAVELQPDDTIWYDIRSFSRPRHWLVRLGYPLARRLQKRFGSSPRRSCGKS